jgi:RNA polymerase sigma-70 factor (ECF subfamily)
MSASKGHLMFASGQPSTQPPEQLPDEELIARIARGDREAFASLYRRRRSDVYRFALHVSASPPVAEDVTHDVFIAVIESAGRYRPGRSGVLPWLLGIARNHARRWLASAPRALSLSDDRTEDGSDRGTSDRIDVALAVESDPLAGLARRRNLEALRRALLGLPVKYREVIVLCDLHELSYVDAAAALQCAVGTVRSRLHRGRAMLAKSLRGGGNEALFRIPAARWLI